MTEHVATSEQPRRLVRCELCGREPAYPPDRFCAKCHQYMADTEAELPDETGWR